MRVVWVNPCEGLIARTGTEYILDLHVVMLLQGWSQKNRGAGGEGGLGEEEEEEGKLVK